MNAKITVAIDNCVPINESRPFLGEHGLSLLVETAGARLLIDAGQSAAIVHNLSLLGVAPAALDMIALSHGHYDHTGGLHPLLSHAQKRIPVYVHPAAFAPRFSLSPGARRFVGIPYREDQLASLGADLQFVEEARQLLPDLWLSGTVPRTTSYETGDARLVVRDEASGCAGGDCQDEIRDDMALFYGSPKGLVVISGCTHAGLVNMVRHGLAVSGCDRLHGWIGGTHLGPVGDRQQQRTIAALQEFSPDFVAANHCTGFPMMAKLAQAFGERFIPAFVGTVIEF